MIVPEHELMHYGMPRRSGRYPWGSGENPYQRNRNFLANVEVLRKQGMSEKEIAESFGMTIAQLRSKKTVARLSKQREDAAFAQKLLDKGYSKSAVAERMGINESSLRSLLKSVESQKNQALFTTVDMLKREVAEKGYLDVGLGTEAQLGISRTKLKAALDMLEAEGYLISYTNVRQLGTGKDTSLVVLAEPGKTHKDVYAHKDEIKPVGQISEDGGKTYGKLGLDLPVKSVDFSRLEIKYAEDGGIDKDGLIEIRRGVEDISLGTLNYAQVRIPVDGKYYLKGMAVYSDDLPEGVDMVFNTNKHKGTPLSETLKKMEDNADNPFGATVTQRKYVDANGVEHISSVYMVNSEGSWSEWRDALSSQFLSKQKPELARKQLGLAYDRQKEEFDEIMSLTNPVLKRKLLQDFADECDSEAVHLKAAAMPRQTTSVILPFPSIKENEVYAPNYNDGERVVLIRHPHGGIFEIPELVVNNRNPDAKKIIKNAKDAIGINPKTAQVLSGADFDGDSVIVIPNNSGEIRRKSPLKQLEGFDPKEAYPRREGMAVMKKGPQTQREMGSISNLITDMHIKMADEDEIARAVKHSMVVIDAAKHGLDYKRSYQEQGIASLKQKYQGGGGVSTLISRAKSPVYVDERSDRVMIDKATGEKIYSETGRSYTKTTKSGKQVVIKKQTVSSQMAETKDARTLSSGSQMEDVYAAHANRLKALANQARKESVSLEYSRYSPSARETYSHEVETLKAKLNESRKQKPLERRALTVANANVKTILEENPSIKDDKKALKKLRAQATAAARANVGKKSTEIQITDKEWEAIQSGAITSSMLSEILEFANADRVRELATPRTKLSMTPAKEAQARSLANRGYTNAEIADMLGVSASTIAKIL